MVYNNRMKRRIISFLLAVLQVTAVWLSFDKESVFRPFSYLIIPLFLVLWLVTDRALAVKPARFTTPGILGLLFAFFICGGNSIQAYHDLSGMTPSLKTITQYVGWTILFTTAIRLIFHFLETHSVISNGEPSNRLLRLLYRKPFLTSFITLCLFYLPFVIIFYPGNLGGDNYHQIHQAYDIDCRQGDLYAPAKTKLYATGGGGEKTVIFTRINNHHPYAHTMLLKGCLDLGNKLFHSDNAGLFLLILLQTFLTITAFSYAISTLIREFRVKTWLCAAVLLVFCLHPALHVASLHAYKEGIYLPFYVLFICCFLRICARKRYSLPVLLVSMIGMVLLRAEGKYMLIVLLLAAVFAKRDVKRLVTLAVCTAVLAFAYEDVLLPYLKVAPGSVREALSTPFLQTARYVRDAGDTLTEEEIHNIDAVLALDVLAERYNPRNSDSVKILYREEATRSDLKRYFITWFKMFLKRPDIYILSVMDSYYAYFFPSEVNSFHLRLSKYTTWYFTQINELCSEININLYFPEELASAREFVEQALLNITKKPVLDWVWRNALYNWAAIILAGYCVYRRKPRAFLLAFPLILQILYLLVTPRGGWYDRYILSITYTLPFMIPAVLAYIDADGDYPSITN